jgi:hypothetical protein
VVEWTYTVCSLQIHFVVRPLKWPYSVWSEYKKWPYSFWSVYKKWPYSFWSEYKKWPHSFWSEYIRIGRIHFGQNIKKMATSILSFKRIFCFENFEVFDMILRRMIFCCIGQHTRVSQELSTNKIEELVYTMTFYRHMFWHDFFVSIGKK